MTEDLRAALEAALPDMAPDQAQAARTLVAAIDTLRNDGPSSGWECSYRCTSTTWDRLVNPRPLTPAEYAEYGIPAPCTHGADEKTTQRAEGTTP